MAVIGGVIDTTQRSAAFAIVLSDPGNGIATKIFVGEDEVGDISAKDDNTVAVAMTRCIVVLHRAKGLWTVTRLPTFDNAKFRGVSWSPDPMIIYAWTSRRTASGS
ncbi:hypothetical protein JL721_6758 [Aureococcus anophagefferens]|nr:hypothetical protein JL721_6758 [Aureococcus anophagefferens]